MSAKGTTFGRLSAVAGYENPRAMVQKFFLPVGVTVVLLSIIIPLVMAVPWWTGIVVFIVGGVFVAGYPFVEYNSYKQSINRNLHYFITYAGTVSTVDIPRTKLFEKISQNENFGYISQVFERIQYLAKDWNLGYAKATREMSKKVPSPILADFLDRFAVALDFGESISVFMEEEQESIMEDFRVEYEQSLETIKLLQDTFVALSISFSFLLGISLMAPLLLEVRIESILPYAVGFILFVDVAILLAVRNYIPTDSLIHSLSNKSREQERLGNIFWSVFGGSMILFMILFLFTPLSFLVSLAMGMTPMMIPGVMAIQYESKVERRDKQFPVFVRVLGSAIEVRDGAVVSSLKSTQIHEFGALNTLAIALYRRLRVGSDRWESWYYFALESGSTMISNFSKIFSESVYMGGESQRIGELVSTSSQELLSLRKLRGQVANGLRGSFYGTLIGLSSVIYITAKVAELLIGIFSQPLTSESGDLGFAQNVLPQAESINFTVILAYISALIVLHSAASSFIMKAIDGGSWYAGIVDFIIMIWIGALLSMFLPFMVDQLLPNVEDLTVAANATG